MAIGKRLGGRLRTLQYVVDEDWGLVQSRRVRNQDGPEIEFGFAGVEWASPPIDGGTAEVIRAGFRILYDPNGLLEAAVTDVTGAFPD